jgi:UDP-glucose 4-epimerase
MKLRGAEILITGGAGFIGSNLAEKLVSMQAHVTIVDAMIPPYGGNKKNLAEIKKNIKFIHGDIRRKELMNSLAGGKDFIFHLAGQTGRVISMKNPKLDFDINCNGTLTVLNAIKKQKKKAKLIFASSRGVIGKPLYFPVDEHHPTYPRDVYGAHKLAAENYCTIYAREYGIPVTILRFNNVYGPRCQIKSNHYGTINLFIAYALQGKRIQLYGDGKQTRDYLYVDDAVTSLVKASDTKANNHIFFVGTEREHSLLEVVQIIKKHIKSLEFEIVSYPPSLLKIDFPRFVSSYGKINTVLRWTPKTTIRSGIKTTIGHYKKNLANYI